MKYEHYLSFFSYFTQLTNIGLCAYFWASGVQTVAYVRNGQKTYPLQNWPRFLQFLHVLLFSTISTFRTRLRILNEFIFRCYDFNIFSTAFVVTAVFWSVLATSASLSTRFGGELLQSPSLQSE
jgi:hypothetical protein